MSMPDKPFHEPAVLDSLRAEREGEWLHHVYIEPQFLSQAGGDRSIVVVGGDGAGKTSARLWLAQTTAAPPERLVVDWTLPQAAVQSQGSQSLEEFQTDLLRAIARELVRYLTLPPDVQVDAVPWLRESIVWFVAHCTAGASDLYFRQLRRGLSDDRIELLDSLLHIGSESVDVLDASLSDILSELMAIVRALSLHGVWVMIDGLESWLSAAPDLLRHQLRILLSTLHLFEAPGLAIKMFAPDDIENSLLGSGAVVSRRLGVVRIRWAEAELLRIAEQRLNCYLGTSGFTLRDLGHEVTLYALLRDYGGQRPLGWLQVLRPFADAYSVDTQPMPLSEERCLQIWHDHPPRLHVDITHQRVFLALRQLDIENGSAFRLIQYLYENRHRTCSYEELYYVGYRGYEHIVRQATDERYEYPKNWKHILEVAISRLRKAVDFDPRNPAYVITERQRGVRLQNIM